MSTEPIDPKYIRIITVTVHVTLQFFFFFFLIFSTLQLPIRHHSTRKQYSRLVEINNCDFYF